MCQQLVCLGRLSTLVTLMVRMVVMNSPSTTRLLPMLLWHARSAAVAALTLPLAYGWSL